MAGASIARTIAHEVSSASGVPRISPTANMRTVTRSERLTMRVKLSSAGVVVCISDERGTMPRRSVAGFWNLLSRR
jgi:hypothetical protein